SVLGSRIQAPLQKVLWRLGIVTTPAPALPSPAVRSTLYRPAPARDRARRCCRSRNPHAALSLLPKAALPCAASLPCVPGRGSVSCAEQNAPPSSRTGSARQ